MPEPILDRKKCENCGTCIEICPVGVFAKENNEVIVKNPKNCIACRACESQCPKEAIKIKE